MKNYFLTAGTNAWELGKSVIFPVEKRKFAVDLRDYKSWSFMLWSDIYVVPIVEDNKLAVEVSFPSGNDWLDWWETSKVYKGGSKI